MNVIITQESFDKHLSLLADRMVVLSRGLVRKISPYSHGGLGNAKLFVISGYLAIDRLLG